MQTISRTIKIKPLASRQAECSRVYMWPTVFGRTIINLWNYNLKHNEEKPCHSWMRSETPSPHWLLPTVLSGTALREPKCPAASFPCRDRALYFHIGRWIFRRWTKSGTLPGTSGSRQAIWFYCRSTLPWADLASRESTLCWATCTIYNHHRESTDHFINQETCMHRSL